MSHPSCTVGVPALAGLLLALLSWFAPPALAQRPVAPKLLPEHTLAYFRILDTPQLISRFRETSIGRMGQDEQIKPLVSELYAALQELWGNIEDRVGLPLDQVLSIPQGEICISFVAVPDGPMGLVVLMDVKDRLPQLNKLLEKGDLFAGENRVTKATEKLDGHDIHIYSGPNGNAQAVQMVRDGTIVITSGKPVMQLVLDGWAGKLEKTLADNDRFNTIMNRCQGTPDDPPQITYYADPIQIVRTVARGNVAASTGLALLPVLGLDGIKGLGGSMIFSTGEFDDVSHFHLMLESPRSGIVEMLAMGAGDTTPEPWVPADAMSYTTLHWKLEDTYRNGAKLWNSLSGEGQAEAEVKRRVEEAIGLDFESEILAAIDGRVTLVQWVEKPIKLNSQANIVGIKLRDPKIFQPTLDKVRDKFADNLEKKSFGGTAYYAIKLPMRDEQPANFRQPSPCMAIVGDYLILTDSTKALEQAIITNSEPGKSLANELDYKLIAGKIRRQVGGESPGMVQFSRPETGMKLLYDLAQSEDTSTLLNRQAEGGNQFFGRLEKAMKDNPLPPFSVIAKYFAPGGAMMVNDETGFHYTGFTLKRK